MIFGKDSRVGLPLELWNTLCVPKTYTPDVVVMKSAKDRVLINDSGPLNGTKDRRIIIQ